MAWCAGLLPTGRWCARFEGHMYPADQSFSSCSFVSICTTCQALELHVVLWCARLWGLQRPSICHCCQAQFNPCMLLESRINVVVLLRYCYQYSAQDHCQCDSTEAGQTRTGSLIITKGCCILCAGRAPGWWCVPLTAASSLLARRRAAHC